MLATVLLASALLSVLGWIYLLGWRGGFWRSDQRLPAALPAPARWPRVTAVIPSRNETAGIGRAVRSLLAQDYPGSFAIIVVDDDSNDGTAAAAIAAGQGDPRLTVLIGSPLPKRWTGKLWAVHQGIRKALATSNPEYLLLTDADIEHSPDNLRRLIAMAENGKRDLVSLMVRLRCETFWERLLIPPFIFFFQKLYPFSWVSNDARPEAAAAGGCLLVRTATLESVDGIAAIRGKIIDDCALAARIKGRRGAIWVGLCEATRSLRPYPQLRDVWAMVARTAFTQLDHSPVRLILTVVGMLILYLLPPISLLYGLTAGAGQLGALGAGAWALMTVSFLPTLAFYRLSAAWSLLLPVAAALYVLMACDSARLSWLGHGGAWKGRRVEANDLTPETSHDASSTTEPAGQQ